jgi:hypothetical protein
MNIVCKHEGAVRKRRAHWMSEWALFTITSLFVFYMWWWGYLPLAHLLVLWGHELCGQLGGELADPCSDRVSRHGSVVVLCDVCARDLRSDGAHEILCHCAHAVYPLLFRVHIVLFNHWCKCAGNRWSVVCERQCELKLQHSTGAMRCVLCMPFNNAWRRRGAPGLTALPQIIMIPTAPPSHVHACHACMHARGSGGGRAGDSACLYSSSQHVPLRGRKKMPKRAGIKCNVCCYKFGLAPKTEFDAFMS